MIRSRFCYLSLFRSLIRSLISHQNSLCKSVCTQYTRVYFTCMRVVSLRLWPCVYWLMFSCNQAYYCDRSLYMCVSHFCCAELCALCSVCVSFSLLLLLNFISLESDCFSDRSFPFLQNSKLQTQTVFGFWCCLLLLVRFGIVCAFT